LNPLYKYALSIFQFFRTLI